jgi:DNA polymerase-3 subunit delta
MKLYQNQLLQHLKNNLASIYLISGDEPLLIEETKHAIRKHAYDNGYQERKYLQVDKNFKWQDLLTVANNLSLFSERILIELNIPNAKPGDAGSKVLQSYAQNPPGDKILVIITSKLDAASLKSSWFKTIENKGVYIPIWPIDIAKLPQWIAQRMQQNGLKTDSSGLKLLTEYVEGNLLAAVQEIEKLRLLYGSGTLSTEQIAASITDNSRFNIFDLADNLLKGDHKKVIHILNCLKNEKVEPSLILWVLTKELRDLAIMAQNMQQGHSVDQVMQQFHIRQQRVPYIKRVLQLHSYKKILSMLQQCAQLDRIIKGVELGNIWDEFEQLCLVI